MIVYVFFFKQKTAYEVRISDWSSDVCSSDLIKARLPRYGRSGADLLVMPGLFPVIGGTEKEAQEKYDFIQSLTHPKIIWQIVSQHYQGRDFTGDRKSVV